MISPNGAVSRRITTVSGISNLYVQVVRLAAAARLESAG